MAMKLFVISHDASGAINPVIWDTLLRFLPLTGSEKDADAVVVPVCNQENYKFNTALLNVRKPVVLMDYTEYGWDAGDKPNVLGTGAFRNFPTLNTEEWEKLDTWICTRPPALHFKRELFQRDVNPHLLPIEFPCRIPAPPIQTKAEFDARPIEVFHFWGLSNPARQAWHGNVFIEAHDYGIHVVDGWDQDGPFVVRTWATIHTPWYNRKPIEEVMRWNCHSKFSISLAGAGQKCFRHSESPVGSIMSTPSDILAWSFPWEEGYNCAALICPCEDILAQYGLRSLYDIYLESQKNIENYRSKTYIDSYIIPSIGERL